MNFGFFNLDEIDLGLSIPICLFAWVLFLPLVRALRERSWTRYFKGTFCMFFAVSFPLFVFLFSHLLVPEWKGASSFGWFGCMHVGKMVFLPVVLWSCVSYCVARIVRRPEEPVKGWVLWGLFAGWIVSGLFVAMECVMRLGGIAHLDELMMLEGAEWIWGLIGEIGAAWVLVPLYVSIWYGVVFLRENVLLQRGSKGMWWTGVATVPFWSIAFWFSQRTYAALPDEPPTCFVVTAASNGPAWLVGPGLLHERRGRVRRANRQLLRFWRLEALWQGRFPVGHAWFRRIYNGVGPVIARRLRGPVRAGACYLLLEPLEWVAGVVCWLSVRRQSRRRARPAWGAGVANGAAGVRGSGCRRSADR